MEWNLTEREHVVEVRILPDPADVAQGFRGRGKLTSRLGDGAVDRLIADRETDDHSRPIHE